MRSFPWDSIIEGMDEETGFPIYDRPYNAEDFRKWVMRFFSDGVFADDPNGFKCTAGSSGLTVNVSPGSALIKGTDATEDRTRTLSFNAADKEYMRIDTVVLRWNASLEVRSIDLYVVKGTPSIAPKRPALQRIEGQIWELGLCDVNIPANTTSMKNARITDTRLEKARCGIVTPFAEFDTTSFYELITGKTNDLIEQVDRDANNYLSEVKKSTDDKFNQSYESTNQAFNDAKASLAKMRDELQKQTDTALQLAKDALEGNVAGSIQNQIDAFNDMTTGINLLRGTRDFTEGTSNFKNGSGTWRCFTDGFRLVTDWIRLKDDEGYTYINGLYNRVGSTTHYTISSAVNTEMLANEELTLSFDIRFKSKGSLASNNNLAYFIYIDDAATQYSNQTCTAATLFEPYGGLENIDTNVWYRVSITKKVPRDLGEASNAYLNIGFLMTSAAPDASWDIRKIKLEKGRINNPIWSPSPFDIDHAEKTGINLLRGTRDFFNGTTLNGTGNTVLKADGFTNARNKVFVDSDGFTAVRQTTSGIVYSSSITDVKGDHDYTLSFEFMIDDVSNYNAGTLVEVIHYYGTSRAENCRLITNTMVSRDIGGTYQSGKWYKLNYTFRCSQEIRDNSFVFVQLTAITEGTCCYKKLCVYDGKNENQLWTASPFDVPFDVIPIDSGGTGGTTAKAAQYNLLQDMNAFTSDADDNAQFVMKYTSPSDKVGAVGYRAGSNVWNWIVSKIRMQFGFSGSNLLHIANGGTGATTASDARKNFGMVAGTVKFDFKNYDSITNSITFNRIFNSAPVVVLSFASDPGDDYYTLDVLKETTLQVTAVGRDYCDINVALPHKITGSIYVNWIAMEKD